MDPATALGLSANVAQFVSYTFSLISKSQEIYNSAKGCTSRVLTLEAICAQLRSFSISLELSSQRNLNLEAVQEKSNYKNHIFAINDLSRLCKADCDRLMEVLGKLQRGGGPKSRWQSLKLAFKTVRKGDEISDLEQRLYHVQQTLTLHVCALTSYWHNSLQKQLEALQSENKKINSQQSARLDDIVKRIMNLKSCATVEPQTRPFQPSDIISLQNQLSQLSVVKTDVAKEQEILRSLSFESRPVRHSSIRDAHRKTFEWIFKNHIHSDQGVMLWWLRKEDGVFWVSGKPGSGKSTLMKFVADHPQTLDALSVWSYPKPAIIVKHFFWSAGTSMQKSWQGLFQTILYEIFRQLPDLITTTCTEKWSKKSEQINQEAWSLTELRSTLQRIANRSNISAKFCFFIDGLDEFEGDHLEFCGTLRDLSRSPHIKLCVASRPWNVFEDSFGRNDFLKLYIHELTRNDIRSYIENMLQEHPRWGELKIGDWDTAWLINQITDRAAGVFLWVFLATTQLRNGLTEYDSYSDMRKRLDNIPTDLEAFFKQILESVEPFYHEKMATTLRIALGAREPAPAAVFGFHDEEYEDEGYALKLPVNIMSPEQSSAMRTQITRRLNGRCRGLLEVNNQHVEFLHRTVMDYLRSPGMMDYLKTKSPARFETSLSLLRAFTAYIKSAGFPEFVDRTGIAAYTKSAFISAIREALYHANEVKDSLTTFKLLDELAHGIPQMQKTGQVNLNVWGNSSNPVRLFFWEPVINASLVDYLHYVLPRLPEYFPTFDARAESFIIFFLLIALGSSLEPYKKLGLLWNLLRTGSEPNETYHDSFPLIIAQDTVNLAWKELLRRILPSNLINPGSSIDKNFGPASWSLSWTLESGLLALFLRHGADPNCVTHLDSSPPWLNFVLLSLYHESSDLRFRTLYLQTLDRFIAAGATPSRMAPNSESLSNQKLDRTTLEVFLDHLSHTTDEDFHRMDPDLIIGVVERLLIITPPAREDLQTYGRVLERKFPQNLICYWRGLMAAGSERTHWPLGVKSPAGKRALVDGTKGEMSSKRLRPASTGVDLGHVPTPDHVV